MKVAEKTKVEQMRKAHELVLRSKESQHQQQAEKIREQNRKEIDNLKTRHDAEMAELMSVSGGRKA